MAGTKSEFRFTGRHMLAIMIAFFGVVIAVNFTMAFFAHKTWSGLVVPNSYVASQNFNKDAETARRQRELGWQETLSHANGAITITLKDRQGNPLQGMQVSAKIGHPVADRFDHSLQLLEAEPGVYSAPAQMGQGQWDADVLAEDRLGRAFRQIHRFEVR